MDFIADGLHFPEGPTVLPDQSILVVEMLAGRLTRVWGEGRTEVVSELGGGPNGAALGPDGAVYVTNNGGGLPWRRLPDGSVEVGALSQDTYEGGRIERVDLSTGRAERLFDACDGHPLRAPNDLVFDRSGGFYFTDLGRCWPRQRDHAAIYYVSAGGEISQVAIGGVTFNGIGLSADERTLYVAETLTAEILAYEIVTPGAVRRVDGMPVGRRVARAPDLRILDSLAVTESGRICVGSIGIGGIAVFDPTDGSMVSIPLPDRIVTNICFGGDDRRTAFITCSATGRLARMPWAEPGLALNFG